MPTTRSLLCRWYTQKNIGGSSKTVLRMSLLVRSRFVFHHGQPLNEVYAIRHALPIIACASPKQRIPVPAHGQTGIGAVQCASVLRKDSEAYAVATPRPLSRKHIRDPEQETSLRRQRIRPPCRKLGRCAHSNKRLRQNLQQPVRPRQIILRLDPL